MAAAAGEDERAALLLGRASALRDEIGSPLPRAAAQEITRERQRLTDRLGRDRAERALRSGALLPLDAPCRRGPRPRSGSA